MITRKNFLTFAGSSIVLGIVACGDDESSSPTSSGAGAGSSSSNSSSGTGTNTTNASGGSGGAATGGNGGMAGVGGGAGACTAQIAALISQNHTASTQHTLTIPLADIQAGVDKTYDTAGPATHCHRVTLTAADFTTLQNGGTVTKVSCNGTDHEFVISRANNPPAPVDPMCASTDNTGTCN